MEPHRGLAPAQRRWATLAIAFGITLAVLDGAIANVALPTIACSLLTSPATSIWIVNAYQLTITISLLPLASLGDIIGYRRIYLWGLCLFTVASLGCALSDSLLTLTLARVIQGFGAAGIMSVNTALVKTIFPAKMLGRGISLNASVVAISTAIGPSLAAAVLSVATWPWLFAINVPIGILAVAIGFFALPLNETDKRPYDYLSALLSALTFGLGISAIDGLGHGLAKPYVIAEFIATIAIGIVFVRRQLSRPAPLLPVDLLRIPIFALSICTSMCAFAAQMLAFVALPFFIQDALGRSAVDTGLLMTPWPLVIVVIAPFSGWMADRYPVGILGAVGLAVMASGLFLLGWLPPHPSTLDIIWRMALCGIGFGFFQTPNNRAMLAAAPHNRSGGASGMLSTARLTGQTLGATLVALIFNMAPHNGTVLSLFVAGGFALAAGCVSLTRLAHPMQRLST
jgi:DHA2 family multidrug resistance protein-like MFS transporter